MSFLCLMNSLLFAAKPSIKTAAKEDASSNEENKLNPEELSTVIISTIKNSHPQLTVPDKNPVKPKKPVNTLNVQNND